MRSSRLNLSLVLGGLIVAVVLFIALAHPWLSPYGVEQMDMRNRLSLPSATHWLGTDNFGRDLWTRLAHGSAISLAVALGAVGSAMMTGTLIGLVTGYFGGWIDHLLMRLVDLFLGFPALILAMALIAVLGPGAFNVALALAAVFWTEFARVVRAAVLAEREREYVRAARALGATDWRILTRHILPNCIGPIVVLTTLYIGLAIVAESGLSFLGLGVQPPAPTWGWTLAYGLRYLRSDPWLCTVAGLAIMITVLGFNLLGDGLRDLLDPRGHARRSTDASPKENAA
ncbi:MAG: ABC transporter permease [Alphaproteobacteria bacterium]|nr:ABC transporter permease [Alphaproteobacteria bacterium]